LFYVLGGSQASISEMDGESSDWKRALQQADGPNAGEPSLNGLIATVQHEFTNYDEILDLIAGRRAAPRDHWTFSSATAALAAGKGDEDDEQAIAVEPHCLSEILDGGGDVLPVAVGGDDDDDDDPPGPATGAASPP
jgi:hypothetical protein